MTSCLLDLISDDPVSKSGYTGKFRGTVSCECVCPSMCAPAQACMCVCVLYVCASVHVWDIIISWMFITLFLFFKKRFLNVILCI